MQKQDIAEFESFLAEIGDVKPLAQDDKIHLYSPAQQLAEKQQRAASRPGPNEIVNPLSMEGVKPVDPDDFLSYQQPGIQDGVFKSLRLGKYTIEHRLSLTGLTLEQSREALFNLIRKCHAKGARALLINHGRGEQSKPFPGLKKSYVKHWLGELEEVIAFHTAQPAHGGRGATYVLLKKHPDQKLINRERNRRR
ncbi:DNA endonuclease SmrA [Salinimonas marina]|uniref:DNA endonuclease SmrA n=1 Tax=Salinimonas marina TaxID=2785918 RepID=A0A7S9HC75_9ALTE|nr:DNA endonuclease SmrA [Salinimonas marina]QPG04986.1 DNA endonuclease SmrA [Salinimonas marina]